MLQISEIHATRKDIGDNESQIVTLAETHSGLFAKSLRAIAIDSLSLDSLVTQHCRNEVGISLCRDKDELLWHYTVACLHV